MIKKQNTEKSKRMNEMLSPQQNFFVQNLINMEFELVKKCGSQT